MLLHTGASLHSCDYPIAERRPSPSPQAPSHSLVRSALRSRSQGHSPPHSFASTSPSEDSEQTLHDHQASALEPNSESHHHHHHHHHPHLPGRSHSDAAPRKGLAVRFLDLMDYAHSAMTSETVSEDESVAHSDFSGLTETSDSAQKTRRRRSRQPRASTTYALAHPAPLMRTKQRSLFQFRPRLMLQLQALGEKRATPAFDVVPSVLVAGSIIFPKLTRHCPRLIKSKCELGPDDLLIVRSEDYSTVPEARKVEDDSIKDRELLGVICTRTHDSADIVLHGDNIWTTAKMPGGSYEFTHTNILGAVETARWVRRAVKPTARTSWGSTGSGDMTPTATRADPAHRWTFSIIDPNTKRHPILGVIQDEKLEVYESYPTVSASSGRHPPTKPFPDLITGENVSPMPSPGLGPHETRETLQVTDAQKELMIATATWISLRQAGWPQSANPRLANVRAHHSRSSSASSADKCPRAPAASLRRRSTNASNLQGRTSWSVTDSRSESGPTRRTRTTSLGQASTRQKNEDRPEAPLEAVIDTEDEKPAAEDDSDPEQEVTPTCGAKVHQLASRLFHGKKKGKEEKTKRKRPSKR